MPTMLEQAKEFRLRLIASYEDRGEEIRCGELMKDASTGNIFFTIDVPGAPQQVATFSRKQ